MKTMNTPKFLYYLLGIFLFLFSCSLEPKQKMKSELISVVDSSYTQIDLQPLEIVNFEEFLYPMDIITVDTFLVFQEKAYNSSSIFIYSTNNYLFIDSILRIGGGPNEIPGLFKILQYEVEENEPVLWIRSITPYMARLNLNHYKDNPYSLFDRKYSFESEERFDIFAELSSYYNLDEDHFLFPKSLNNAGLFSKGIYTYYWEKYNYKTNTVTDTYYEYSYPKDKIEKYHLATFPESALKPDKKKLALFPWGLENFSIMDLEKKTRKDILLDKKGFDIGYAISRKEEIHLDVQATNDLIFSLRKNYQSGNSYLQVYDWDGIPKYEVNLDREIRAFSIQEKTKRLYAIADESDVLVYDLGSIL